MRLPASSLLSLCCIFVFIATCPFTKVEESFNLQATHDLLYSSQIGGLDGFDHLDFPGVVPRTFLAPLVLAATSYPLVAVMGALQLPKLASLYVVRGVLGFMFWLALLRFRGSVARSWGQRAAFWFDVISGSQFHLLFYGSRTLPNTFSVILCLLGFSLLFDGQPKRALGVLVFVTVVIRCDTVVLLGTVSLGLLLGRRVRFMELPVVGIPVGTLALGLSLVVDSFFWKRWIWPEGEVLYFNTILNKSSEYGVSPWHWYFTSALPRALLTSCLLVPVGVIGDWRAFSRAAGEKKDGGNRATWASPMLAIACFAGVGFVALLSFLPHKELRFVFPALPLLNVCAACGMARVEAFARTRGSMQQLVRLVLFGMIGVNLMASWGLFLNASVKNYPGAVALLRATSEIFAECRASECASARKPRIHISAGAAISGISRFLEVEEEIEYSKREDLQREEEYAMFDYLVTEAPGNYTRLFAQTDVAQGEPRLVWREFRFATRPSIFVMKNQRTVFDECE